MGIATSHVHNHDQDTPAQSWAITHNLNTLAPVVDVWTEIDGTKQKIIPFAVKAVDAMSCTVEFTSSRTGTAAIR